MPSFLRLRQICLVAHDLEGAVADLCAVLGLEVCHRDPNVGKYGLVNALMPVGTSFIEVVSPQAPGPATAAGRYLERRGGDGGYMVINDCDDVMAYRARALASGVRIIAERDEPGHAHLMQLHPRDTGGCILEIDTHAGGERLDGKYAWAGPHWQGHVCRERALAMTGCDVQSESPVKLAERWSGIIARPVVADERGLSCLRLDNAVLRFVPVSDGRGEGLAAVRLDVRDSASIVAAAAARGLVTGPDPNSVTICGTRFVLRDAV